MDNLSLLIFLIAGLNFKILFVMVVMIWQCYILILAILLLLLLKGLTIVVLFIALANMKQFICLIILGIYKMLKKTILKIKSTTIISAI